MPVHTPQQQAAITAQGDVLVMAGAGAGKTSTLVARILDRVLHGSPRVSLDRVLVVTFTEAAATEMRHRLSVALEAAAQPSAVEECEETSVAWARDQRALLESARVSTLHAFCLRLVRDHFHHLDLDPQFAVQDAAQAGILRNQVLDEVLRAAYLDQTDAGAGVGEFLRRHAADGDRAVRHLILRVHDYARTLPEPETWMAEQRGRHARNEPECWW
ncbi:MAG: UvrD-helicase domain-containing protein, partial [Verrucomicrobiales bacterium]|nr:UvrD-helicase domain-containing protein [Verrucomicrobiales bacterium]